MQLNIRKSFSFVMGLFLLSLILIFPGEVFASGGKPDHNNKEPKKQVLVKELQEEEQNAADSSPVKSEPAEEKYSIEIFTTPEPLVKGEAILTVKITDQKGDGIKGAEIKGTLQMDAKMDSHGGMSEDPISFELNPDEEPGLYQGELELDSVGEWKAQINITYPDGQQETFESTLEVVYDGPNLIFLGSITAIILISIIWAQIIRNKNNSEKGGSSDVQPTA